MSKKRILIVDDDDFVLSLLEEALHSSDYETVRCQNGKEAFAFTVENDFDAVITDVNMPEKDGLEFVKELKSAGRNIPILMISGEDFGGVDKINYLDTICHYADEILGKPFSKEELLSTLDNILENKFRDIVRRY